MDADPRFHGPGDARLRPDSPLVDEGRPGPLSDSEPHEDALGYVREVDGNGDRTPRRDIGALELQPPAPFPLPGNVLVNPGAEAGTPAERRHVEPAPPGWTRTGAFTSVRYGTVVGSVPFPSRRVSEVLAAGDAFFAAGPGKGGTATQVADLRDAAPEIDLGRGTIALSAALGGYRSSADGAIVEATFRAPGGRSLGSVRIGPVSAADRAGATTLLPRRADARIPPLTRSIAVTLRSTPAAGSYDDAYFDSVSLVPRTDGVAPHAEPAGRVRPFLGATVISRRTPVDSRRRAWVRLACAASVVAALPRLDHADRAAGQGRAGAAGRAARVLAAPGPREALPGPAQHGRPQGAHRRAQAALGARVPLGPRRAGRHEDRRRDRPDRPRHRPEAAQERLPVRAPPGSDPEGALRGSRGEPGGRVACRPGCCPGSPGTSGGRRRR